MKPASITKSTCYNEKHLPERLPETIDLDQPLKEGTPCPDILWIDSDRVDYERMRDMLERAGHRIHILSDPLATEAVIRTVAPRCLVMADTSPFCAVELFTRLCGAGIDIPAFICVARADVPMAMAALHAGAYDVLEKPLSAAMLARAVKRLLRTSSMESCAK